MFTIALTPGKIDMLVDRIKEDVCRNPDANLIPYVFEFMEMEKDCERNLICDLMLNLYAQDVKSLKRDLAKLAMLGNAQAPRHHQRVAMLHSFMEVASLYFDFSELLAMYDKVKDTCRDGRPDLDT